MLFILVFGVSIKHGILVKEEYKYLISFLITLGSLLNESDLQYMDALETIDFIEFIDVIERASLSKCRDDLALFAMNETNVGSWLGLSNLIFNGPTSTPMVDWSMRSVK